jgi:hypothetical protein
MNQVQPEAMGFSSQRLARINAVMQRYVDAEKLAGIVDFRNLTYQALTA